MDLGPPFAEQLHSPRHILADNIRDKIAPNLSIRNKPGSSLHQTTSEQAGRFHLNLLFSTIGPSEEAQNQSYGK